MKSLAATAMILDWTTWPAFRHPALLSALQIHNDPQHLLSEDSTSSALSSYQTAGSSFPIAFRILRPFYRLSWHNLRAIMSDAIRTQSNWSCSFRFHRPFQESQLKVAPALFGNRFRLGLSQASPKYCNRYYRPGLYWAQNDGTTRACVGCQVQPCTHISW